MYRTVRASMTYDVLCSLDLAKALRSSYRIGHQTFRRSYKTRLNLSSIARSKRTKRFEEFPRARGHLSFLGERFNLSAWFAENFESSLIFSEQFNRFLNHSSNPKG